jgi:hypothetical protein
LAAYGGILIPKIGKSEVSFKTTTQIAVSDQTRDARVGKVDSFFVLPKLSQTLIRDFCNSIGYQIDVSLEGRKLNPKMRNRKKKDSVFIGGFDMPVSEIELNVSEADPSDWGNLSLTWQARYLFNLYVSDQFAQYWRSQGKPIRIYNVVGGGSVFDVFLKASHGAPAARCLVSYARMSNSFLSKLCGVVNGHRN